MLKMTSLFIKFCFVIFSFLSLNIKINAQHLKPDTINAFFISEKILFDGRFTEKCWENVNKISNFTQREPEFGSLTSEKTEVAVCYDKNNLYIGIWCYQKEPDKIVAKYMQRDFSYKNEDNFQILLSPFNDGRNGYLFVINPNGARADLLISGGEEGNKDWNGVWDAKTSITDEGWFAEIMIPFNSFQFKNEMIHNWAINFERDIQCKNEQVLWQGWSRDNSIFAVVNAGTLTGINDIGQAKHFELKPYAIGGWESMQNVNANYTKKAGLDVNINITPDLKLNLTTNTDFAQVEADRIPVNLTRFDYYYPEKREFFLEGYNLFQFSLGNHNQIFYTRNIGIKNLKPVSIIAGARFFGKINSNNIGALNIEENNTDDISKTNNTVIRYKRDIGEQSYIGGIFTNKYNNTGSNQVFGLDGSYISSNFLGNKNLIVSGNIARSFSKLNSGNNSYAYRFFIDYPNDLVDNFFAISGVQENFFPGLGFIHRKNYNAVNWNLDITPRIFSEYGIRKMLFMPWESALFFTQSSGAIESFYNTTRPFGILFKSGELFEFNLMQSFDRIDNSFEIFKNAVIPSGKYWMHRTEFLFSTYKARKIFASFLYNWGSYYTGNIKNLELSLGINISKHLNIKNDYIYNIVNLPDSKTITHELANYLNYAFTTKFDLSLFTQWNSLEDIILFNLRLHWIPQIGSDLYLVYNQGHENLDKFNLFKPLKTTGVGKLVYRFTF